MKVLCPKCRLFKRGKFHHSRVVESHGITSGGSEVEKYYKIQGTGTGTQRTCQVQFGEQKGTLVEKIKVDDQNKTLQILIEKGPAPFEGVSINMQVKSIDDKTSEFSVWSEVSDEQSQPMQQIFQMMAQGLKQLHELKN